MYFAIDGRELIRKPHSIEIAPQSTPRPIPLTSGRW